MTRGLLRALAVALLVALCTAPAAAQRTGGSFGGGSFGGGGGGGYSGGGGGYSGGGGGYSGGHYSGGHYYGGGGSCGGVGGFVFLVGGIFFVLHLAQTFRRTRTIPDDAYFSRTSDGAGPDADVTVLRFGLDARVRPFVQAELDRIARTCDTRTDAGLVRSLREVAVLLRRLRTAWVYGGAVNEAMTSIAGAERTFRSHVAAARATFQHELVRNADGQLTTAEAPASVRLAEEGAGLVLVTIVVAARQELFTVQRIGDGDDLRRALESLTELTAEILVAMEIVWTPADPDDRMSSVELEALLPGQLFPIRGAMVGKVVCDHCAGPFPAELMTCPHCGAPAASSPRAPTA